MGGSSPDPLWLEPMGRRYARPECETGAPRRAGQVLAAQAELFDQGRIAGLVLALEVVKQAAALGNQSEQATAGMVILFVVLEVLGQVLDALRIDGNLDFRRTCVALDGRKFGNQGLFTLCSDRHRIFLSDVRNGAPTAGMSSSRGQ